MREKLIDPLELDSMNSRYATIKTAHARTCEWLLITPEYKDWCESKMTLEHHGILWIKGKPGSGKSTIMKFAYSAASRETGIIVIKHFFGSEDSMEGMYRSLLYQLFEKIPEIEVDASWLSSTIPGRYNSEILQSMFVRALKSLGQQDLICFIDDLNTCGEDQCRQILEFFIDLAQIAVSLQLRFKVCLSSRHYPHVTLMKGIELVLEGQDGHERDLAIYLTSALKIGHSKFAEQTKSEMLQRTSGIFLWTVITARILEDYDSGRLHALSKRLDEIPEGLEGLFKHVLTRDTKDPEALLLCLQWLLYARRPLTREELYFAILVGLTPETVSEWDPEHISEEDMDRLILHHSNGLAETANSKIKSVHFIHESVRDYLLEGDGLRDISPGYPNSPGLSHERLKRCCLSYMNIDVSLLQTPTDKDITHLRQEVSARYPFLEYATDAVLYHAEAAASHGCLQDEFVHEFDIRDWISLDNLYERYAVRRHTLEADILYILAEKGLANLIQARLRRFPRIDIRGERFQSPLKVALMKENEHCVKALLSASMLEVGSPGQTNELLLRSTIKECTEAARYLIESPSSNNKYSSALCMLLESTDCYLADVQLCTSLLRWAASEKDTRVAVLLLEKGVDAGLAFSVHNPECPESALERASFYGQEGFVRLVFGKSNVATPETTQGLNRSLSAAAVQGNGTIALMLLLQGAEPEAQDRGIYDSPLYTASLSGHDTLLHWLMNHGADRDTQLSTYADSLQLASDVDSEQRVSSILAVADQNAQDRAYGTTVEAGSKKRKRVLDG